MQSLGGAFEEFISAFNGLDMKRFANCLSPSVSLFPPDASSTRIIEGAASVEEHFTRVFESEGPLGPDIRPTHVSIRHLGSDAGLVTFQFPRKDGSVGKRSIVFQREASGWRITHIHAANTQLHERSA